MKQTVSSFSEASGSVLDVQSLCHHAEVGNTNKKNMVSFKSIQERGNKLLEKKRLDLKIQCKASSSRNVIFWVCVLSYSI